MLFLGIPYAEVDNVLDTFDDLVHCLDRRLHRICLKCSTQIYTKHDIWPIYIEVKKIPNHLPIESLINRSLIFILIKFACSVYEYPGVFSLFQSGFLDKLQCIFELVDGNFSFDCLIWRPRKKFNSLILLMR